jgi:hypothetical protein
MNKDEQKKTEELKDEELDRVAGGTFGSEVKAGNSGFQRALHLTGITGSSACMPGATGFTPRPDGFQRR